MDYAFKYVQTNGISSLSSYPYVGSQQNCSTENKTKTSIKVTGYKNVGASEYVLQEAVCKSPVNI